MRPGLLLDEHYPGWLADQLSEQGVDVVAINQHRVHLRGADDIAVLRAAVEEGRVVVTEDITTFPIAAEHVPDHRGIVYVHPQRFPRTRPGLSQLGCALREMLAEPPSGLGELPVVHWLEA